MTYKNYATATLSSLILLLTACTEPPKCADEATLSQVKKSILQQILKAEQSNFLANIVIAVTQEGLGTAMKNGLTEKEIIDIMGFETPHAIKYDEKIRKYSCDATFIANDKVKIAIKYDSQLDDKSQHLVSVNKIADSDLFAADAALLETINKNKQAPKAAPKSP